MGRTSKLVVWMSGFGYCVVAALAFQLVFLPLIAPAWHAGDGLMVQGDWLAYHQEALELRDRILTSGWGQWRLWYNTHSLSGILAALYTLLVPKPWVFVPIAAALQATSFLLLSLVLFRFVGRGGEAIAGALPLLLFPTALLWILQPLKDGFSICGFMMFLYTWFLIGEIIRSRKLRLATLGTACGMLGIGLILIWLARPYLLTVFLILGAFGAVVIALRLFYLHWKGKLSWRVGEGVIVILVIGLVAATFLPIRLPQHASLSTEASSDVGSDVAQVASSAEPHVGWIASTWMPDAVDRLLRMFSEQRDASSSSSADSGSTIDGDVRFRSAIDIIRYLPRALQIALFAPFPNQWLRAGSSSFGTFMRRVSGLEMVFCYFMIPFCLVMIWGRRRLPEMLLVLVLCGIGLSLQPLFVVNAGTMVRLRYPYYMVFVCLGFLAFLSSGRRMLLPRAPQRDAPTEDE